MTHDSKIKKYVEMPEEILVRLSEGLSVQGGLQKDLHTGKLVFNPHDVARYKPGYKRPMEIPIGETDFGRFTETPKTIKRYESYPKRMGAARMIAASERSAIDFKNAIMNREIVERV